MFSEVELIERYPFTSSNKVLIDVGAHHGWFTERFTDKGWKIIAFEPEKENRQAFTKRFGSHPDVQIIPKAVSNKNGEKVPFYVSNKHFGIHSLQPFHESHELAYEVETTTLTSVMDDLKIEELTLLKVDVEGADFMVLQGLDYAKFKPELIMIEFMDERSTKSFGYTHHDVVNYMEEKGYVCFVSEWAPIKEYAVYGESSEPHTWLQCVKYPTNSEPAWGNLVFVPIEQEKKFEKMLHHYFVHLGLRKPLLLDVLKGKIMKLIK